MKKKLLIFIGPIVIILLSLGVWYFFFSGSKTPVGEAIRDVLPFGNGGSDVVTNADDDRPVEIPAVTDSRDLPQLLRLSETPVAGAASFIKNGSEVVRFADRATGHIYDINPRTLEKTKISNNTQPKIYEAYFRKDGNGVIFRSLKNDSDEINNVSIELVPPKSTSTDALYTQISSFLRGNITSISISDTGKLAYSLRDSEEVVISDFNGNNKVTLFSAPFTDWDVKWSGGNITLTTKASSATDGYSYSLTTGGGFSKLIGPINGLTVNRSPNNTRLLYSSSASGPVRTYARNNSTGQSFEILPTPLPEKCVWSKKTIELVYCATSENWAAGGEPDLWYQGITHLDDNVWRFDTETGFADIVLDPEKSFDIKMDVYNPFLTVDENYLIFMNKNDLSLWALKLVE